MGVKGGIASRVLQNHDKNEKYKKVRARKRKGNIRVLRKGKCKIKFDEKDKQQSEN